MVTGTLSAFSRKDAEARIKETGRKSHVLSDQENQLRGGRGVSGVESSHRREAGHHNHWTKTHSCTCWNPRQTLCPKDGRAILPDTAIIVGLGNPGPRYADTRHNIGWQVLDLLANQIGVPVNERRPKAVLGAGYFAGRRVALAKPRTFMNNSGEAIEYLLARFGGGSSNLLVIYDEMALLPGRIRLRAAGSDAGHNGIRSIIRAVGGTGFPRLRIGIGAPPPGVAGPRIRAGQVPG